MVTHHALVPALDHSQNRAKIWIIYKVGDSSADGERSPSVTGREPRSELG